MRATRHTYLRTHRLSGNILSLDTAAEELGLREQAARSKAGRAAKTLVKEGKLRVTLVVLQKGAVLGAHRVEGDVTLHVIRGQFEVQAADATIRAGKGNIIALGAGVAHQARAVQDATVIVTASMR
jgi:quercetin dioxygenase-like cupin family protein